MPSVNFETFLKIAPLVLKAKKPLMMRGRHGIGKSELVYQIGKYLDMKVVERRASQMTEGDLIGLPVLTGEGTTSWNPPDWFKICCDNPVILFLDEVDRAVLEVRQGIFELTDSRKLNGNVLHPDTLIIAAVNGGSENGGAYQTGEMDPAENDRWTIYDVCPNTNDWLVWARGSGKVLGAITSFIAENPAHLEVSANEDFEPNKVYPSQRSWKRLSDTMKVNGLNEWFAGFLPFCQGFIGEEAGAAFSNYFRTYENAVSADDIMERGQIDKVRDYDSPDLLALIGKIEGAGWLKRKLTKKQVDNFREFFFVLPAELANMVFSKFIGQFESKDSQDDLSEEEKAESVANIHNNLEILYGDGGGTRDRIRKILLAGQEYETEGD